MLRKHNTDSHDVLLLNIYIKMPSRHINKTRCILIAVVILMLVLALVSIVYFTVKSGSSVAEGKHESVQQYTKVTGSSIELQCSLINHDENIDWYFNGNKMPDIDRISLSGKTLSIHNITSDDGGEYVCRQGQSNGTLIQLAVIEVLLANATKFGEGPHWEERSQSLLFVDYSVKQLNRWNSATGDLEKAEVSIGIDSGGLGFVVPYANGGYIASVVRSLIHFDWNTKTIKTLHEVDHGTFNEFNDGKVDPKGRVWAGTFGYYTDIRDPSYFYKGSMYMMDLDGSIHKKWENITLSNGFAWSIDNKTMYFVESIPGKVYKFDYDVDTGNIEYRGIAIDFEKMNKDGKDLGIPDGMTMDREGMLWIACYQGSKIVRFNPTTGELLRVIDFKGLASGTTSCCFGGPNHDVLYVTSAAAESEEEAKENMFSGSVFRVTGLGVRGFPGRVYRGVI